MIDEFRKMGYTEEQSQVLEKLSAIGDSMHDIDVHDAEKMLSDAMKKYHLDKGEESDLFEWCPDCREINLWTYWRKMPRT